jgi:hypothetical protein
MFESVLSIQSRQVGKYRNNSCQNCQTRSNESDFAKKFADVRTLPFENYDGEQLAVALPVQEALYQLCTEPKGQMSQEKEVGKFG